MKYIYKIEFEGVRTCKKCMLSGSKGQDLNGETVMACYGLGLRPKCPEEGCRKDCPLQLADECCEDAEKLQNGKCRGYQKARWDDEPTERCKECKIFELFEID